MNEVIIGALGTSFGFALSEIATAIRKGRREKIQARSVRMILKLEMTLNLQELKDFWEKVCALPKAPEDPDSQKLALAQQVIEIPIPQFEKKALESQLSHLVLSLKEQEVVHVLQFYYRLRKLKSISAELTAFWSDQQIELQEATKKREGVFRKVSYFPPRPFDEKAPKLWDEVEHLVNQTLDEGNPFVS